MIVKCKLDGAKLFEVKNGNIEIVCRKGKHTLVIPLNKIFDDGVDKVLRV